MAAVAVASTALLLDYVGQRRKLRMAASSQVDKKEADKPSQNGTATNADYDGNGKKLGAVVDARPLPRSDAAGLVRRACVLSACGLTAVGCHRCVSEEVFRTFAA